MSKKIRNCREQKNKTINEYKERKNRHISMKISDHFDSSKFLLVFLFSGELEKINEGKQKKSNYLSNFFLSAEKQITFVCLPNSLLLIFPLTNFSFRANNFPRRKRSNRKERKSRFNGIRNRH